MRVAVTGATGNIGTRTVRALAAAWALRLVPASPGLLDLALQVPIMDVARARDVLGWTPRHTAREAVGEFLDGLRAGAGRDTPPVSPGAGGAVGAREFATATGTGRGRRP